METSRHIVVTMPLIQRSKFYTIPRYFKYIALALEIISYVLIFFEAHRIIYGFELIFYMKGHVLYKL